jgi:outer membrane protein assembly factor BamB
MYHRDNTRTGYLPDTPDPQQLAVAWSKGLDGAVYAEPLVVGAHVIAATENNTIYSLDAQTGQVEWQTHIGDPVTRADLPCGNISPLGITGTPVYDPQSGFVFAVAEVSGPSHMLVGLDAGTGQIRVQRSADAQGMAPLAHQQRAALALSQGYVYIAYGGLFGDCGDYHGTVVASRTDGTGPLLAYQVPTGREGGIWATPGPVVDAAGHIFVSVGNGSEVLGGWDQSDSVLRLSPTLKLEDGFAPDQWRQDNLTDADLGSLGPVLLPGNFIFIAGKAGIGYVLNAEKLGGVAGQVLSKNVCHAYGGAAVVGSVAFVPCNEGVQQIQLGPGPTLALGWRASGVPGSPVVGGHTVYSLDRGGTLHALDLNTGSERAAVDVGATSRFSTPTLFQDRIFVGTMTGIVAVTGP